ncbi:hypothetical protein [Kitasatospora atroaurantiaca]|uniref:hypothetical protein n=1 Tax=Kitasatospora atroaurantiaca TaxID=285545 RepID=UPI00119F8943|nr:hypothetical protein [Kitasatospora atroaurantiaca]
MTATQEPAVRVVRPAAAFLPYEERSVGAACRLVRDGSRTLPCLIDAGGDDGTGREMALVNELTKGRWGAELEPLGKTVHADLTAGAA